jgi:hypothetical protein
MTPSILLNLLPRSRRLLTGIGKPVVQHVTVPFWNGHDVWRVRETLPDVLNELETLGGRQPEDFVTQGAQAHERKVLVWA